MQPQVVDLVDAAVALARGVLLVGHVGRGFDEDRVGGARPGAQLAADALFEAVVVAVELVTSVEARHDARGFARVLLGDGGSEERSHRDSISGHGGDELRERTLGVVLEEHVLAGGLLTHRCPPSGCRLPRPWPVCPQWWPWRAGWRRVFVRAAAGREAVLESGVFALGGGNRLGLGLVGHPDDDEGDQEENADAAEEHRRGELDELRDAAHEGDEDEPAQGDGHEALPAEVHELVVAETQQGRARPDQQEHEEPDLEEEPEHAPPAGVEELDVGQRPRGVPPPKNIVVATAETLSMLTYSDR